MDSLLTCLGLASPVVVTTDRANVQQGGRPVGLSGPGIALVVSGVELDNSLHGHEPPLIAGNLSVEVLTDTVK